MFRVYSPLMSQIKQEKTSASSWVQVALIEIKAPWSPFSAIHRTLVFTSPDHSCKQIVPGERKYCEYSYCGINLDTHAMSIWIILKATSGLDRWRRNNTMWCLWPIYIKNSELKRADIWNKSHKLTWHAPTDFFFCIKWTPTSKSFI